jgi:hypothetical protein
MKCDECQTLIEEYYDSELDADSREKVRLHLSTCVACARVLHELRSEHDAYAHYERNLFLEPILWTKVQARLEAEPRTSGTESFNNRQSWLGWVLAPRINAWAALALVIAGVGLTVVIMKYAGQRRAYRESAASHEANQDTQQPAVSPELNQPAIEPQKPSVAREFSDRKDSDIKARASDSALVANRRPIIRKSGGGYEPKSPMQLVTEAEQKYLTAISMLSRQAKRRQSRLDPESRQKFDQALAAIDSTIARTRQAVRQNPNDPFAVKYMLTAYAKKVDVLRGMTDY